MTFEWRRRWLAAPILAVALPMFANVATAQDTARTIPSLGNFSLTPSGPQPTPTPSATPVPVTPPLSLPAITPTPIPRATPTARPSSAPTSKPTPKPAPEPTPTSAAEPNPAPGRTPTPTPAASEPNAVPVAAPTPVPVVAPTATPVAASPSSQSPWWPWAVGLIAIVAIAAGAWSRRRRSGTIPADDAAFDEPIAQPTVTPAPPPPAAPRARLALVVRPTRAGLNMLSATVDCEVTVTNTGDAPAADIRVRAQLLSASGGQDAEIATFAGEPIVRPAAPPFGLAPGEARRLRTVVALPRDAILPMAASGRPMFIPLVVLNAVYTAGEGRAGQAVQAFAVGVERVDSPKLAPFWLDGQPKMQDAVAARPHAVALER